MASTPSHDKTPLSVSPRKRLLRSPAPGGPSDISKLANDDEAERQRRRVERHNAVAFKSPHGAPSPRRLGTGARPGVVGESGLNQAQLAEHYASCIKLSSENKINAKNAFGLHLIDCMDEMLRQQDGLTNFQVAGCTLDASAKIYSGRVDSIYADTYKMLCGLSGQENKKPSGDGEDAPEGGDSQKTGKGKKKTRHSRTVEQNVESLNVKKFDLEFEVDPLFSKTSATFDEGGPKGLLLNQLSTRGDSCEVVLDSNAIIMPAVVTETKAASSHDPKMTDLSHLRDHLHLLRLEGLQICPDFSDFLFMEDQAGMSGSWSVSELLAATTPSKARAQQDFRYEAGQSDDDDDDHVAYGGPAPADEVDGYPVAGMDEGVGFADGVPDVEVEGGDMTLPSAALPARPGDKTMVAPSGQSSGAGNLMLSLTADHNEYSYFDLNQVANWAGPNHWNLRPRSKEPTSAEASTVAGEKTRERTKRKAFEIDFTAKLNTKQLFAQSKATLLTKATLGKQTVEQTTLPEDLHFDANELLQLFTNPKWKLVRMAVPEDDNDHGGDLPWYNYQNERDCEGFCLPPGAAAVQSGGDGAGVADTGPAGTDGCGFGVAGVEDDDDDDDIGGGGGDGGSMGSMTLDAISSVVGMQSFLEQSRADPSMFLGDNLVAQPRKVQRIQIDYAKAAKKMDVKKLKAGIWSVLTTPTPKENMPVVTDVVAEEPKEKASACAGTHSFSGLYSTLPKKISSNMTRNLSVPIAFVCLLHLANEKNLKVSGVDGRGDLMVSQDS